MAGLVSSGLAVFCALIAWQGAGQWPGLGESLRTRNHPRAEATVTRNEVRRKMAYPTVRYVVDGRAYELAGNGRSPAEFTVGEKVTVRYDPADPAQGRIVGFQQQYLPPLAILAGAAFLLGLGVLAFSTAFERRPGKPGAPTPA